MDKINIGCNCDMIYKLDEEYKIVISCCKINCIDCIDYIIATRYNNYFIKKNKYV